MFRGVLGADFTRAAVDPVEQLVLCRCLGADFMVSRSVLVRGKFAEEGAKALLILSMRLYSRRRCASMHLSVLQHGTCSSRISRSIASEPAKPALKECPYQYAYLVRSACPLPPFPTSIDHEALQPISSMSDRHNLWHIRKRLHYTTVRRGSTMKLPCTS